MAASPIHRYLQNVSEILLPLEKMHPFPMASEREMWVSLPEELKSDRIKLAEGYLGYEWPSLPATVFMEFARNGNRSHYEGRSFARRRALTALVVGECIEGNGRFLDDIINGIWCVCEESFWGVSAHNSPGSLGYQPLPDATQPIIDLFAGETAGLLSWTHYLLKQQLDKVAPIVSHRIRAEVKRRILDPYLERDDFWWMNLQPGLNVNNWNPWCNSNCLTAFLLIEDDDSRRAAGVSKALLSLSKFLESYHSDGGCDEGTSYWDRAGGSLFDCLELLHMATEGKVDLYDDPLVKQIGAYLYKAHIDGDYFVNFADGGAKVRISSCLVYRYGRRIGDEKLTALGSNAFNLHRAQKDGDLSLPDNLLRGLPAIWTYKEMKEASQNPPYVKDAWLDGIEFMTAREAGGSSKGLYIAAKGGHNGESHNHNDVGQFILCCDGKPVVIDAGVETYTAKTFSSRRYEIWTMQSAYHNLPTVNGVQQSPGAQYKSGKVAYSCQDGLAELAMDISGAYPKEAEIEEWLRTIRLNRGGTSDGSLCGSEDSGLVEVIDSFTLAKPSSDIMFTLLLSREPEFLSPGCMRLNGGTSLENAGGSVMLRYDGELLKPSKEEIPITDSRLRPIWGESVWRVLLKVGRPVGKGESKLAFAMLDN